MRLTSKRNVIELGLQVLQGAGTDHICKVCIASGGSCCQNCGFLKDGVGCQQRNTSCTAWLCGFIKLLFYEAGLLGDWERFWDEVPGQQFREDATPDSFPVNHWLEVPNIRHMAEAFAEDLVELKQNRSLFWIHELKETLDAYLDDIQVCDDPQAARKLDKQIRWLIKDFRRFRAACQSTPLSR